MVHLKKESGIIVVSIDLPSSLDKQSAWYLLSCDGGAHSEHELCRNFPTFVLIAVQMTRIKLLVCYVTTDYGDSKV